MITIRRVDSSPYFAPDFAETENRQLSKISNEITFQNDSDKLATILLTNTATDYSNILNHRDINQVKLIIHPNSGYDNLSLEAVENLNEKNIPLVLGNTIRAQAVAQYTLNYLFQFLTGSPSHSRWVPGRKWDRPLFENENILIVGFGHIGQIVLQTMRPLGANINIYDPFRGFDGDLDQMLAKNRVVLILCGLNSNSRGLINRESMQNLPEDFILINPARGALVDFPALLEKLKASPSAQAAIDVFDGEPAPLENCQQKNLVTTSHIAGVHQHLDRDVINFESSVIKDFIEISFDQFQHKYKNALISSKIFGDQLI